jgi:hypothetical protein
MDTKLLAHTTDPRKDSLSDIQPFLCINHKPIYFKEDWDTGIGGGLWSTGKAMALYFRDNTTMLRRNLRNIADVSKIRSDGKVRALELGSGNGLLSVCLGAAADDLISELMVTDLHDHLELIQRTLDDNLNIIQSGRYNVVEHKWGDFEKFQGEKFDFIFGSDLAYWDLQEPLIKSLKYFCHLNTICLIGVTMHDTKPSFFSRLRENGFMYDRIPDHAMSGEFRGTTFGLFVIRKAQSC